MEVGCPFTERAPWHLRMTRAAKLMTTAKTRLTLKLTVKAQGRAKVYERAGPERQPLSSGCPLHIDRARIHLQWHLRTTRAAKHTVEVP